MGGVEFFGGQTPPLFWAKNSWPLSPWLLTPEDRATIQRSMEGRRFDPSLVLGATRCRFGGLRSLICAPITGLRPFPTTFWLLCPWLVRKAGDVESHGGVRRLEAWLSAHDPKGWRAYHRLHQRIRLSLMGREQRAFLRRFRPGLFAGVARGGVGGIRGGAEVRVKCLHLQAASWLALGRHPGAEWLRQEGLGGDCGGAWAGCP